ncbi:MAG: hypothetical protein ACXABY_06975 [Candidatus Thorarchaeota archaeon]|jgi:hypothetical protein
MELFKKPSVKTIRYKLKQSELTESCKSCIKDKIGYEVAKENQMDTGWAVAGGITLAFAIISVVYIKVIMRKHIESLVEKYIVDGRLTKMAEKAVTTEVGKRVYYSYADLKRGAVRITVEDRTDSLNNFQGD